MLLIDRRGVLGGGGTICNPSMVFSKALLTCYLKKMKKNKRISPPLVFFEKKTYTLRNLENRL